MKKIRIVCVGKLKEKYLSEAVQEYVKRINKYFELDIVELDESKLSQNPTAAEVNKALDAEAEKILQNDPS